MSAPLQTDAGSFAPGPHGRRRGFPRPVRRIPLPGLLAYYAAVAALWFGAEALLGSRPLDALRQGTGASPAGVPRGITALLAILGALVLVLPVAAVYMRTRRLRYDPSIVHTLVVLPVVAAGILLVVENSLARAFSLAGIVAAIRFRNTLPEPRDVVYILLVLGIGLAAGGMALDVAFVMSGSFNVLALLLWGYNVGSIYAAGSARLGILSVGERRLLVGTTPAARGALRRRALEAGGDVRPDGLLILHTGAGEPADSMAGEVLFENAREWHRVGELYSRHGVHTLGYLVRLRRGSSPANLLADLDECSMQILAAEFLPLSRELWESRNGGKHRHARRREKDELPAAEAPVPEPV